MTGEGEGSPGHHHVQHRVLELHHYFPILCWFRWPASPAQLAKVGLCHSQGRGWDIELCLSPASTSIPGHLALVGWFSGSFFGPNDTDVLTC